MNSLATHQGRRQGDTRCIALHSETQGTRRDGTDLSGPLTAVVWVSLRDGSRNPWVQMGGLAPMIWWIYNAVWKRCWRKNPFGRILIEKSTKKLDSVSGHIWCHHSFGSTWTHLALCWTLSLGRAVSQRPNGHAAAAEGLAENRRHTRQTDQKDLLKTTIEAGKIPRSGFEHVWTHRKNGIDRIENPSFETGLRCLFGGNLVVESQVANFRIWVHPKTMRDHQQADNFVSSETHWNPTYGRPKPKPWRWNCLL